MRRYGIPVAVNDQRPGEQPDVMDCIGRDEKLKVQVPHLTGGKGWALRELFISVKTTKKFHRSRMGLLLLTWISRVKEQVGTRMSGRFVGTIVVRGQGSMEECNFSVEISFF